MQEQAKRSQYRAVQYYWTSANKGYHNGLAFHWNFLYVLFFCSDRIFFRILSLSNGISISIRLSLITFEVVFPCKLQKYIFHLAKVRNS